MASAAQIQANRSNARKSTGPRTAEGKERASQNALKHGLLAREAVIVGEDPTEFEMYREGMLQTLAPVGPVEEMLAERIVGLSWRLRRAEKLQNAAFAALEEGERTELLEARLEEWKQHKGSKRDRDVYGALDENAALAKAVVEDFAEARVLDRMLMYERRIESSLYRAMAELRREREARQATGLASFDATPTAEEPASAKEAPSLRCHVSSDGRSPDAVADSRTLSPGGSDKRSPRSLSMASSQEQDHRQTSLSMPPEVEERPLSTSCALAPASCETKPIAGGGAGLKCQVSRD